MKLQGSCHCRAVRFSVESGEPCPFMRCYCSICRKTAGGGGYAVNLGARHETLEVQGREHLSVYRARMEDGSTSSGQRHFCSRCGSALWLYDPTWPDLVHPHASAIDTPLPLPPERVHIMLGSMAGWVQPDIRDGDERFDAYPRESLAAWHRRHGM
ncbi:MAG: GFA family protein [Burkholderiaceae bacterium]|nr:GFA family protein [Burkholderiaceae bacterium]